MTRTRLLTTEPSVYRRPGKRGDSFTFYWRDHAGTLRTRTFDTFEDALAFKRLPRDLRRTPASSGEAHAMVGGLPLIASRLRAVWEAHRRGRSQDLAEALRDLGSAAFAWAEQLEAARKRARG